MKIAYNPKTANALTTAPSNNDITFDLKGLNIFVRGEKFKGTDTIYSVFKKHTSDGKGGYNGLVPVPSYITTNNRFLREDGTWVIPTDSHYITHLYVGTANNANNSSTSNGSTYIKLYDNSALRNLYLIKGTGKTTVSSDNSGNISINTPTTTSWTDITGKPDSFKPLTHYHHFFKGWTDTRGTATTPNNYNGIFTMLGIKTAGTTLGLSQELTGSYATILGWRGWSDYTGGYSWEVASTDKNRLYVRSGSTTTWGNWNAIAYLTDNFPSSQINRLTLYSKYTSLVNLTTTDTLNQALGKLEYKADLGVSAYNIVKAAYDGDGKIENLTEILKVLEGISDTLTIKGILGNYRLLNESLFYGSEVKSNFWINRCKENGGGWAYEPINIYKNDKVSIISHYGVYGEENNIIYTYIGSNSYNSSNNLKIYPSGLVIAPTFQGKLNYTYLTGSTSTSNQVIVSTGTPNNWTLKTLGNRAFDNTAYLPLTGGTITGTLVIAGAAAEKHFRVRGIVGTTGDTTGNFAELYLQYGINKKLMLGNNGAYYISEDGSFYNGKSNFANKSTSIIDYGNSDYSIKIGWYGDNLDHTTCNYIAGYSKDVQNKEIKIKTIAPGELLKLINASPSNHTHNYLPLSGGTMTNNARIAHDGNMYIGRADNDGWIGVQDICSASSLSDNIWSIRTNGNAIFKNVTSTKYISTISTGTLPYACNSTTLNVHLNADLLDGRHAIDFLLRGRMTNPSNGTNWHGAIPFIIALKSAGTPLYTDPEFILGTNNISVYNNSGNGTLTITRQADNQGSANNSGYILKITNNGGIASPELGGFVQYINSRQNAVFAQIFRAKIPTGYNLRNAENSQGTGYTTFWLTDTIGTNKWEWYVRITICGNGGNYSTGGHVYLSGPTGSVTWYLAYCNVIDLTKGNYDGLRTKYSDLANSLLGTLQLRAGTFSNLNFNGSSTITAYIPTHTSHLINNSGFITQHLSLANYYTKTEADSRFVNVTGDTMSGALTVNSTVTGTLLISTIKTGTAPLKISSTTVVSNLNSDLLDGFHETSFYRGRSIYAKISGLIPITSELTLNNNLSGSWSVAVPDASGHLVLFNNGGGSTRYIQLYSIYHSHLYWRCSTDSNLTNKPWKILIDSINYSSIILKIGTTTKGSATLPIYLNAGVPTACNTTLGVSITGNATTATKLLTNRIINGTSFNGTTNITTAYWGATRTITLSGAISGSASINGSLNVTITTTYQTGSIDGRYVGGKKVAEHGSNGTAYTADTYSSNFVNKAFVAYAERGSWSYASNGYITTDIGVNIPLAGTAIFQWGANDINKTLLFITPYNNSGVNNPAANEMLFYTSNGSGYTSAWTRVLTHRNYITYTVTKTGGGASGTWGISITGNAETANRLISTNINDTLVNKTIPGCLYHSGGSNSVLDKPSNVDAFGVFTMQTAHGWYGQILISSNIARGLYWRTDTSFNGDWKKVLDSSNFTEYTVTKTGSGASGTWNINISGSAAKTVGTLNFAAGKFSTKSFNGSTTVAVNVPTHTSHLTNDSGFITSSTELSSNITTITKSLKVTQAWMDTGILSNNLSTGTYIILVYVHGKTDGFWYTYSSGIMSWYADSTDASQGDEIILHRAGHAMSNVIYLRTLTTIKGVLKLQISANKNISTTYEYIFKFKRVI